MGRMWGLALTMAALAALPVSAQQMSDEELLQRFETQRDAFRSASESGLGRTRGLTLVTVDDAAAPTSAAADAPPDGGTTVTGMPDAGPLTPLTPTQGGETATPVVFGQLAPELQVNARIEFAFDSATLSADQKPKLDQLCRVMKASDIKQFRVVGHTDASGPDAYNEKLSILRANEVQRYLVNDCGIAPDRLEAVGMGERFLFNSQDPRSHENRRVEFQALA